MYGDDDCPDLTPSQWQNLGRIGDVLPSLPEDLVVGGRCVAVVTSKGERWPSVRHAARALGVSHNAIARALRGRKTVLGRTIYAA